MDFMSILGAASGITGLAEGVYNFGLERDKYNSSRSDWIFNVSQIAENRAREDNAVQRRVADLKAAGLSPVLAAGSAASSQPISTPSYTAGQGNNPSQMISQMAPLMMLGSQLDQSKAVTKSAESQAALNKEQQRAWKHDNLIGEGVPGTEKWTRVLHPQSLGDGIKDLSRVIEGIIKKEKPFVEKLSEYNEKKGVELTPKAIEMIERANDIKEGEKEYKRRKEIKKQEAEELEEWYQEWKRGRKK